MPKPQTVAVLALVSIDGKRVTVDTTGTRAAPGSKLISWELHWGDGKRNQDPGIPFIRLDHEYENSDEYQAVLIIKDSKNRTVSSPMIIIKVPSPTEPIPPGDLQIVTASLPNTNINQPYEEQLQGTGGILPYIWSISSGNLPTGLSLVDDTIQGIPTVAGSFGFQIKLTDDIGTETTKNFIIQVSSDLQIVTSSFPPATIGQFYSQQLVGSGGFTPYSWLVFSGNLPNGLALVGDTVQGTPTTAGTFNFQIRLQDNVGTQLFRNFTIVASSNIVVINTQNCPSASQGENYNFPISISGGTPPYILTKIAGNFPTGINISGTSLVGTPTILETQNFTLRATDSLGAFDDQSLSINVVIEGPNDFFEQQIARPECAKFNSLRSQSLINQVNGGSFFYVFGTPQEDYPNPQDAAKLIMAHSLAGPEQLRIGIGPYADGNVMIICDFWWGPEFRTNVIQLNHKFLQIEDQGDSGSGDDIYCEPRCFYRPASDADPIVGRVNLRSYSLSGLNGLPNPRFPEGLVRHTPWDPPGQNGQVQDTYRYHHSVWTRFWFLFELFEAGTNYPEWSSLYNSGNPVGRGLIVNAAAGNPTIIEHNNQRDFYNNDISGAGTRVTIAGNSNSAINGVWQATIIDSTHFSIPLNSVGGSGGTITQHFHRLTWWLADENRNPVRIIYKVPFGIRAFGRLVRFMYELNTSDNLTQAVKGFFIPSSPSIANPTIITTSVPHNFVNNEWAMILGNNVIPNKTRGRVTVIDSTHVSFPFNMTTSSTPAGSGEFAGTHGYLGKQLIGYAKNIIVLRNFTANEADTSWLRKPVG